MRKIFSLLRFDLKCLLRPGAIFVLLAPAIIAASVYFSLPVELFTRRALEPFSIAITDNGDDMATRLIASTVGGIDVISDVQIVTRERGLSLLEQGYVAVFVDIPIGLEASLIHNNPTEIRVYGGYDYPIQSTLLKAAAEAAADGVSAVQSKIYLFNELAMPAYEDITDFFEARARLAIDLMWLSLRRARTVEVTEPVSSGYLAHLIALVTFIGAGVAAVYISINTSEQLGSRSIASMRMAGLGFGAFAANKCVLTIFFSIIAILPPMLFIITQDFGGFSPFRLILGAIALAAIFSLPCLMFSFIFRKPAQTALCGFGFLFCMLFVGGAFPAFLTGDFFAAVSQISPSTTAQGFTAWAFGGTLTLAAALPLLVFALFLLPTRRMFSTQR